MGVSWLVSYVLLMQESMVVRKVILADQIPNIDMCRDFHCHRTTADQL